MGLAVGLAVSQAHFSRSSSSDEDDDDEVNVEAGWNVPIGGTEPTRRIIDVYDKYPILSDEDELKNCQQWVYSANASAARAISTSKEATCLLKAKEEELEKLQRAAAAAATAVVTTTKAASEANNALEDLRKLGIWGADGSKLASDAVEITNKVAEAALKAQSDIGNMISLSVRNVDLLTSLEQECKSHALYSERRAERIRWDFDNYGYYKGGPPQLAVDAEKGETQVGRAETAARQSLSKMKTLCEKKN